MTNFNIIRHKNSESITMYSRDQKWGAVVTGNNFQEAHSKMIKATKIAIILKTMMEHIKSNK